MSQPTAPSSLPHSVVVVSAPSGTGKTTLNRRMMAEFSALEISISHTTRAARPGEKDGVHYHFTDEDHFQELIRQDAFVEWARVHGSLYGTSKTELERIKKSGHMALLEIDVQGWLKARQKLKDAVSIFILPPTLQALWQRLENRASDSIQNRMLRLHNAFHEISKAENYQYFIVNDDLEIAYGKLKAIVMEGKPGDIDSTNGRRLCEKLMDEYHNAAWLREIRAQYAE